MLTSIDSDAASDEAAGSGASGFVHKAELPKAPLARLLARELRLRCGGTDACGDRRGRRAAARGRRLLDEAGFEVVAQTGDAEDFLRRALAHRPMSRSSTSRCRPTTQTTGCGRRSSFGDSDPTPACWSYRSSTRSTTRFELIGDRAEGVGYLLKERVGEVEAFIEAVRGWRPAGARSTPRWSPGCWGGAARTAARAPHPARARRADGDGGGKVELGIAEALFVTQAAVEKHITSIFEKLELDPAVTEHRRVLAVLGLPPGLHLDRQGTVGAPRSVSRRPRAVHRSFPPSASSTIAEPDQPAAPTVPAPPTVVADSIRSAPAPRRARPRRGRHPSA